MERDSLSERVAVNTADLARLDSELERARLRIHALIGQRHVVDSVVEQVKELRADMPTLARQAAREAVTEYLRRQHAERFSNWRTYAALLSAGAALGALVVALALGLG